MVWEHDRRGCPHHKERRRQGLLHRPFCRPAARRRPWGQDGCDGLFPVMNLPIKFGTDGWRGIIADTFTFENVRYAAQATADYFKTVEGPERAVFIGFDVRFQSEKFALTAAEVFAGNGFRVVMIDRPYPTPY